MTGILNQKTIGGSKGVQKFLVGSYHLPDPYLFSSPLEIWIRGIVKKQEANSRIDDSEREKYEYHQAKNLFKISVIVCSDL